MEPRIHKPARKEKNFPDGWSKQGLPGGLRNAWLFLSSLIPEVTTGSIQKTPTMRGLGSASCC
ncbi:rCG37115 [Rattus norvegicus]|uniref:RCG37115 n=1 Tax=Rattus norvegicus TaxID=10116 RepID=A6HUH1_RAT|nr:rCG37115 [Rattus norvegicus]